MGCTVRAALLLICFTLTAQAAEAKPVRVQQQSFFWPPSLASRCVAPGAAPKCEVKLEKLLKFKSAEDFYTSRPSLLYDGYWTNLVNTDDIEDGFARMQVMRDFLQANNLFHTYLDGRLTGNIESAAEVPCGPETQSTRTIDGSCNYPDDPLAGAVNTRFGRNVPLNASHPDLDNLLKPNPLLVSAKLLHRRPASDHPRMPFLNLWAGAWVQFMLHDWELHSESSDNSRPISIPVPPEHPWSGAASAMVVGSTRPDPTRTSEEEAAGVPPTTLNTVTHWWDANQLYGSDVVVAALLREYVGGRMKLNAAGLLPLSPEGFGLAGVNTNWWLGLELLTTLFYKEHNAIADNLAKAYPTMTDQQLYDKARMITAAAMAKIHTTEWTPAILPNKAFTCGMWANWKGPISLLSPQDAEKVEKILPRPHEGIHGYGGSPRNDAGVKFSMTEEFTAVHRMHSLLPESFTLTNVDGTQMGTMWTRDTLLKGARDVMEAQSFPDLAATFGINLPGSLTLNSMPRFMTNITLPGNQGGLDLAAVDILRDRERGVPRYNQFRRLLRLRPLSSIDDLAPNPADRAAFKSVYGDDVELVDLLPGLLAEAHRPDCFGFGETQFQIFLLMASRRLSADRFYTSDYTAEVYTEVGMKWIEAATFRDVLLRHVPELQASGWNIPLNAFNPWTRPGQP